MAKKTFRIGRVVPQYVGDYVKGQTYAQMQSVTLDGNEYVSLVDNNTEEPSKTSTKWRWSGEGGGLSGVSNKNLNTRSQEAGMLSKALTDVNLDELKKIVLGLDFLMNDLSNLDIPSLSRAFMQTKAYNDLAAKKGTTVADVMSRIHYIETDQAIDFSSEPHEFIHAVYRFSSPKQKITQTLPSADAGKTIIIEMIEVKEDCILELLPAKGQMISGSPKSVELVYNGLQGIMYPTTGGNYDWVHADKLPSEAIPVLNEKGEIVISKTGLQFIGAEVTVTPTGTAVITVPKTRFKNQNGNDSNEAPVVELEAPLQVTPQIDSKGNVTSVTLRVKRGYYQKAYPDAYYASLSEPVLIMPEINKLHKGNIWFDDVIADHGPFISADKTNKAYGIEEDDELDPNVTGGTMAFAIVRLAFRGNAPADGTIKLELTDKRSGQPISFGTDQAADITRAYKKGQPLGVMQKAFTFEAKGLQEFQVEVKHNMGDTDEIILEDRMHGNSCILISYVHPTNQINPAVLQFERDTNQRLLFQKNYFGEDLFDMSYLVQDNVGEKVIIAGTGGTMMDGAHFYNNTVMSTEVKDGVVRFIGDAPNACFFTFGKIFSARKTIPMRRQDITVDVRDVEPKTPVEVAVYSWIGEPDKYDDRIYEGIVNNQPVLVSGWTLWGKRDLLDGYSNFGMEFTIPSNANNYAVVVQPKDVTNVVELNLSTFKVSAKKPFYAIQFEGLAEIDEHYEIKNTRKAVFGVDVTGYLGLRYSVGIGETKLPVGWLLPTKSDIFPPVKLNPKWKDNVGHKGEGVLEVTRDCRITNLYAILRMFGSDEKNLAPDSVQTVQVYFSKEDSTGIKPIEQTRTVFQSKTAEAPKYVSTNKGDAFQPMELKKGEFIWLYSICNFNDGAYFKTTAKGQYLVQTVVEWEEIEESPVVSIGDVSGIKLVKKGKEVDRSLYDLEFDVDTNTFKAVKK